MRWLLLKDLQILRRSPLLVSLLVIYPIAIALMIGFALSSPPGKPKVAILNQIPPGKGVVRLGAEKVDAAHYARNLLRRIDRVPVKNRADLLEKVKDGKALAGVIIPADLPAQLQGGGQPQVEVVLNTKDPLVRQYVDSQLRGEFDRANQAISRKVAKVAIGFLGDVLHGGRFNGFGIDVQLLGLEQTSTLLKAALAALPKSSLARTPLEQAIAFASTARTLFTFSGPAVQLVSDPIQFKRTELSGRTTTPENYAVTIAAVVSLMFVTVLLAAGLLALEREEHAFGRLVRGLVTRTQLLAEKITLSAGAAAAVTLVMVIGIALFASFRWVRLPLWAVALIFGGAGFAALGVAIGGLAREVRAASLLSFLLSLPIAFLALVPQQAVSEGLYTVLSVVSALFPFKPALQAMDAALNGTRGIGLPLVHLAILTVAFGAIARVSLRRFA